MKNSIAKIENAIVFYLNIFSIFYFQTQSRLLKHSLVVNIASKLLNKRKQ